MARWWAIGALALFGLACGGLPFGGGEELLEERPAESPLTWGLLMSWLALGIGGGSAVIGIWVDRDRSRPLTFALLLSGLILAAMGVGALQGYLDEEGAIETRANLERMLDMVEDLAENNGDPALAALVAREDGARRPRAGARVMPEPVLEEEAAPEPAAEAVADEAAPEADPAAGEPAPAPPPETDAAPADGGAE